MILMTYETWNNNENKLLDSENWMNIMLSKAKIIGNDEISTIVDEN